MQRPVVIIGGWLSAANDYRGMANILAQPPYNRIVYIVDIGRRQWASLRDPNFTPVMDILARTVELAMRETGAGMIDLIGHSAGGRIARAYLGDVPCNGIVYDGKRFVDRLITLGTAHSTVEIYVAKFGAFVNEAYPGAYYPSVHYRTVAGKSVMGRRFGRGEEMLAFRSYELTCGDGNVIGDGIIPTHSCYLEGAENMVLQGVRHAPYNAPQRWYGARGIVEEWFNDREYARTGADRGLSHESE
jgi:pimeloyl-ACP methyl ester carboxylesterase